MIKEFNGDIFVAPINACLHQVNLFHVMGAGIARHIRENFPEAYEADCQTEKADPSKLGTFSFAECFNQRTNKPLTIFNCYSQTGLGGQDRQTSYDAVVEVFENVRDYLINNGKSHYVLGIPYKYGCGLANGSWPVVEAIIKSVFEDSPIKVLICRRPGD